MRVADFICVGAQKAGTTWLYEQIVNHPDIFMPAKELDFFFKFDQTLTWYSNQFSGARERQLCGDISPNYAAFQGLAVKIHEICPQARIIHLLRNPVDRAFSQYKMATAIRNIPTEVPFIEAFRKNLQYMKRRGEYVTILDEYEPYYPLGERAGVFWYDAIKTDPAGLVRSVLSLIGADPDWPSPRLHEVVDASPTDKTLAPDDERELASYYAPFNERLRSRLGLARLPWDPALAADSGSALAARCR